MEDTPIYTVKQTAALTGLTVNQIRSWEQRYHLLDPQRAANGYRLYRPSDLQLLRCIAQAKDRGTQLVSLLQEAPEQRHTILMRLGQEYQSAVMAKVKTALQESKPSLLHALTQGDALAFERLLVKAQVGLSLGEAIRHIDMAILREIGIAIANGQIEVYCSHIASSVIRRRVQAHVQTLGIPKGSHPVLLAGAPDDHHEVGLLVAQMELAESLIPSLYVGPHCPVEQLKKVCQQQQPRGIVIALLNPLQEPAALFAQYQELAKLFPIAVGGCEAKRHQALCIQAGLYVCDSVAHVIPWQSNQRSKAIH